MFCKRKLKGLEHDLLVSEMNTLLDLNIRIIESIWNGSYKTASAVPDWIENLEKTSKWFEKVLFKGAKTGEYENLIPLQNKVRKILLILEAISFFYETDMKRKKYNPDVTKINEYNLVHNNKLVTRGYLNQIKDEYERKHYAY